MHHLLKLILKILAKRAILRYKPIVIGITGSVGKTTTKEAVFAVLSRKFWVRKNEKNYNNEFGVPMAVLGIDPAKLQNNRFGKASRLDLARLAARRVNYKLQTFCHALWLVYGWPEQKYPKALVLELAADRPGDIEYFVDIVRPQVGIVTAVGEVPVHIEFYASPQEVANEKYELIRSLPPDGLAVLNYDDQTVLDMKEKSKAKVITFGFSNLANLWISDISYFAVEDNKNIGGLSFKINYASSFIPVRISGIIGQHQLYGVLAAVAVGINFGMNLVDISAALERIEVPRGRMNLLAGIKNSAIINDTYNASPLSTHAALDTLRDFAKAREALGIKGRRIAVLGDMRELGKYEIEAHRSIGKIAAERCDVLITVGAAAKFIADSAAKQMSKENIMSFNTSDEAKSKVQEIIQEGDIVLVKGSRSMKMEKIVEEIKKIG